MVAALGTTLLVAAGIGLVFSIALLVALMMGDDE